MDVVVTIVAGALYLGAALWVHRDARALGVARGQAPGGLDLGPTGWLVGALVAWVVVVPTYLMMRGDYQRRNGGAAWSPDLVPAVRPRGGAVRFGAEADGDRWR